MCTSNYYLLGKQTRAYLVDCIKARDREIDDLTLKVSVMMTRAELCEREVSRLKEGV